MIELYSEWSLETGLRTLKQFELEAAHLPETTINYNFSISKIIHWFFEI